ncbi:MAG: 1-deoxy-D-xylulose-5-phosphate reductoisomerase, partial [Oscillospiraceae bacterium]
LTFPNRVKSDVKRLSFTDIGKLTFYKADIDTFICLKAAIEAAKQGGIMPAVVNGANEQAVKMFLEDKIQYHQIGECVFSALNHFAFADYETADEIIEIDRQSRKYAEDFLNNLNIH